MKEHWMRRNYGGKISEIVRELAREPETYGPGWRCNVFEPGGVQAAEAYVTSFLASLPSWSTSITAFLDACACIAENADDYRGIVFTDPLDDAEVRWNPVERATKKLPFGPYKLEVRLPGRTRRHRFTSIQPNAAGEFRVNRRELGQLVAPCLAHMLDAYFNGLVLGELRWEGIVNIVAIHDGWFVPAFHDFVDRPGSRPGQYFLDRAIEYAGQSWLTGLGKIYEQFIAALTGTRYERFALDIRDLWRDRVTARRWPKFAAN